MFLSQTQVNGLTPAQIDGVLFCGLSERAEKSDFAIVCGTSPKHALIRAQIAAEFYKRGGTERLIVSGAAVSDKTVTESAFLKSGLIRLGVDENAVIEEPHACDTIQNLTCSLTEICKRTDIMKVGRITVITEPFHLRRALCLANILLPNFIEVRGYTNGAAVQRGLWKTDERLSACVKTEVEILKQLIIKGRLEDIKL